MKNQCQREIRHAAAVAFMDSLNQLHTTLQTPASEFDHSRSGNPALTSGSANLEFDMGTFEQAVADIESFIQQKQEMKS